MSDEHTMEADVVTDHLPAPRPDSTLFGTNNPAQVVEAATVAADALNGVLEAKRLYSTISGRKHVLVEGWTLLGSMLGVYAVPVWTRPLEADGEYVGWEARVEARTRDGAVVGAAEAEVRTNERNWKDRDSYALRSMAQTRATSKALRLPLGFVVALAGYEAAPAEEIPGHADTPEARQNYLVVEAKAMFDAAELPKDQRVALWGAAWDDVGDQADPDEFLAVLQEKVNEVSGAAVPNDEQPSSSPAAAPEPVTDDRKEDVTNVSGADSVTASTLEGMEASGGGGGTDAASKQAGEDPSPPSDDLRALAAKLQAPPLRTERQVKPLRDWCHDVMAGLVVAGLWDPGKVHETLTVYEIEDVSAERSPNKLHELVTYLRAKGGKAVAEAAERAGVDLEVRP